MNILDPEFKKGIKAMRTGMTNFECCSEGWWERLKGNGRFGISQKNLNNDITLKAAGHLRAAIAGYRNGLPQENSQEHLLAVRDIIDDHSDNMDFERFSDLRGVCRQASDYMSGEYYLLAGLINSAELALSTDRQRCEDPIFSMLGHADFIGGAACALERIATRRYKDALRIDVSEPSGEERTYFENEAVRRRQEILELKEIKLNRIFIDRQEHECFRSRPSLEYLKDHLNIKALTETLDASPLGAKRKIYPIVARKNIKTSELEMLVTRLENKGPWAIPVGNIEDDGNILEALSSPLLEEVGVDLGFGDSVILYRGADDDRLNAHDALKRTTVVHKHLSPGEAVFLQPEAEDGVTEADWIRLTDSNLGDFYPSHGAFVRLAIRFMKDFECV